MSTRFEKEIKKFNDFSKSWWDKNSELRALYEFNKIRVPFLANALLKYTGKQLNNCEILDAGCGGGFFTEALAKKGAKVIGLDLAEDTLKAARKHLEEINQKGFNIIKPHQIEYVHDDICNHVLISKNRYDAVIASEVIEHVKNPALFLKSCSECVKPEGLIYITTPNRTWLSYFCIIFMAERVLGMIPKGTHEYNMFVSPKSLKKMASEINLTPLKLQGTMFLPWPFTCWINVPFTYVHYMYLFQRNDRKV